MKVTMRQTLGLWLLFVLILAWPLVLHGLWNVNLGLGDLRLYRVWAQDGFDHSRWPVLDFAWVYPVGALLPIAALSPLSHSALFESSFIATIVMADGLIMLTLRDRFGAKASAWWLVFLFLMGPVALSRLDGLTTALGTLALFMIVNRPRAAAAIITLAAWIKVAHGFWMLPVFILSARKLRNVLFPAALLTVAIVAATWALGGGSRLTSFAHGQSDRTLQIESVAATPIQLAYAIGNHPAPHYNESLNVLEFTGTGAADVARFFDLLLPLSVVAVGLLTIAARRRNRLPANELLLVSIMATTLALIVFNKVGSPQYILWLSSPVLASFALRTESSREWNLMRRGTLVVAGLTQLIFPIGYASLIEGGGWAIAALVLRNAILVALFIAACSTLVRAAIPADKELRKRRY